MPKGLRRGLVSPVSLAHASYKDASIKSISLLWLHAHTGSVDWLVATDGSLSVELEGGDDSGTSCRRSRGDVFVQTA